MIPKFRAWKKAGKELGRVGQITFELDGSVSHVLFKGKFLDFNVPINEIILMQSTGLVDKNGKEIFEGDIVKRYRSPFFKAKWEYQIETVIKEEASLLLGREFGKNFGTIPFNSPFAKSVLLEVVGNIYENPELLEDKE